jgi:hypothetical protein
VPRGFSVVYATCREVELGAIMDLKDVDPYAMLQFHLLATRDVAVLRHTVCQLQPLVLHMSTVLRTPASLCDTDTLRVYNSTHQCG